jgi:hypothetical protein
VLQLIFCLCGQDAHTTVGGFLCIEGILPAVASDDTHACKMLFVDARDCAS